jgi:purine-binding chemotaxis protein CheW
VANVKEEEVEATPSFGVSLDTAYILGMAKTGEAVRILLDIDKVLDSEDIDVLANAA